MYYFDESYYLQHKLNQFPGQTMAWLKQAIQDAGMTPQQHYESFGRYEYDWTWFDKKEYLAAKLNLVNSEGAKDDQGNVYTTATLVSAINNAGMTVEEHYVRYGQYELPNFAGPSVLNPNPYFNEKVYLTNKLAQVHSLGETEYTLDSLREAIANAGMTVIEHYERYGSQERYKLPDGNWGDFIEPSASGSANYYYQVKLKHVQTGGETINGKTGSDIKMEDLLSAMQGMSHITHYLQYGQFEDLPWDDVEEPVSDGDSLLTLKIIERNPNNNPAGALNIEIKAADPGITQVFSLNVAVPGGGGAYKILWDAAIVAMNAEQPSWLDSFGSSSWLGDIIYANGKPVGQELIFRLDTTQISDIHIGNNTSGYSVDWEIEYPTHASQPVTLVGVSDVSAIAADTDFS